MFKKFKIIEFHGNIYNLEEKCNQKSTNMPSVGLVNQLKPVSVFENFEKSNNILHFYTN